MFLHLPFTAEKVTGNLANLAGQVAPCDICSIYSIRKAMGIAVPPEPPGPFIDLTTGTTHKHLHLWGVRSWASDLAVWIQYVSANI